MMRTRMFRSVVLAALPALLGLSLASHDVSAQPRRGGKPKPPAGAPAKPPAGGGDIELDEPPPDQKGAKKDSGVTPTAGQMTEAAAKAKREFANGAWENAALGLYNVYKGNTGDDEGNKQYAQFDLAIALYNLKYYQAAYGIFSEIAEKPSHLKFNQTLLWLAKLATELPEPADIVERVGKYSEPQINQFKNESQSELYWQLNYLLGRYKYRNRQFEDAIRLFKHVDRQSKYFIKGQFFTGISYVQLRQSVPAVKSFQEIVKAIDDGVEGVDDEARIRDLAFLSQARTFYSASVVLDEATNQPKIKEDRLSAAVKYWNKVDVGSEYWLDAMFEESWAYFMAGDYAHALGNIHAIEAPYFPNSFYPEAQILKAIIYFSNCQYEDATVITAKFQAKYQPMYDDLNKVLGRFKGDNQEEAFYKFLKDVRDGKADLPPRIKIVVSNALSDRQLLRHIKYVELLDEESKRVAKASAKFTGSPLGGDVKDALQLARDIAVRNAGQLARERYQRNLDELNEHLRDAAKILIDITAAQRGQLDAALAGGASKDVQEIERNIVKGDDEHVIWPFKKEYWRDELQFYRQSIKSKCAR
ncbi:MAG: hypothetical protein U0174_07775 [Polyangiaceae bacterium]